MLLSFLTNLRPEAYPDSISIFGIDIKFYAIIILSGAVIGTIFGFNKYGRRLKISSDLVLEGLALGLLFGVLGGRIYYVIFEHDGIDNIIDLLNPRNGGLAIHGAIIAVAIYLPLFCKIRKIDLIPLIEIVVPIFLFGQVVGRWGNFMNQEAFGPTIDVFGGLTVENIKNFTLSGSGSSYNPFILTDTALSAQREFLKSCLIPDFIVNQMYIEHGWIVLNGEHIYISGYYHPTYLYESLMNLCGIIFIVVFRNTYKKYYLCDGVGIYMIWYGVVRIIIESLRTDPLIIGNTGIKMAQVISGVLIVGGILLLVLRRVFKLRLQSWKEYFADPNRTIMIKDDAELESVSNE